MGPKQRSQPCPSGKESAVCTQLFTLCALYLHIQSAMDGKRDRPSRLLLYTKNVYRLGSHVLNHSRRPCSHWLHHIYIVFVIASNSEII